VDSDRVHLEATLSRTAAIFGIGPPELYLINPKEDISFQVTDIDHLAVNRRPAECNFGTVVLVERSRQTSHLSWAKPGCSLCFRRGYIEVGEIDLELGVTNRLPKITISLDFGRWLSLSIGAMASTLAEHIVDINYSCQTCYPSMDPRDDYSMPVVQSGAADLHRRV
jgi:hypothetical protein